MTEHRSQPADILAWLTHQAQYRAASGMDAGPYRKAAAEIASLRSDREQYNGWAAEIKDGIAQLNTEIARLRAENERLRAALVRLIRDYEDETGSPAAAARKALTAGKQS